jgi:Domain of unknown function (DUF4190)
MTSTAGACQSCGNQLGPTSRFCDRCGTSAGGAPPAPVDATGQPPYQPTTVPGPPPPPPNSAPAYAPPPPGYVQPPVSQTTNGLSVASMVLGIVWVFGLGSILAVIFGFIGRKQIKESGGRQAGGGMALAGIILGFIGVASLILWIVLVIAISTTISNCFDNAQTGAHSSTCANTGTGNSGGIFNNSGSTGATSPAPSAPSSMGSRGVPGGLGNSATTPGFTVALMR